MTIQRAKKTKYHERRLPVLPSEIGQLSLQQLTSWEILGTHILENEKEFPDSYPPHIIKRIKELLS